MHATFFSACHASSQPWPLGELISGLKWVGVYNPTNRSISFASPTGGDQQIEYVIIFRLNLCELPVAVSVFTYSTGQLALQKHPSNNISDHNNRVRVGTISDHSIESVRQETDGSTEFNGKV